jgi:protocatechuate 3,4-dioxygenase beta subunit
VKTDATGSFVVPEVPVGSWIATAERDGYISSVDGSPERAIVAVAAQTPTSVTLHLTQAGAIHGRITDANGNPVAGLEVQPVQQGYDVSGRRTWLTKSTVPRGALTDDHGEYRVYSCRPGEYYVQVLPLGRSDTLQITVSYFPGPADPALATPVTVREGEETAADITLPPFVSRKVSGTIHIDRTGTDALNVILFATLQDRRIPFEPLRLTVRVVGSDGAFSFARVPPGSYEISAEAGTPIAFSSRMNLDVGERDINGIALVLHPPMEFKLHIVPGAGAGSAALVNMGVSLLSKNGPATPHYLPRSDPSGNLTATDVPAGLYDFRFSQIPAGTFISEIRQGPTSLMETGLKIGSDPPGIVEIAVSTGSGRVEGITDLPSGVPSATVVLAPEITQLRNSLLYKAIRTDAAGHFTINGIAPGRYRLFAWENPSQNTARFLNAALNAEFLAQYETRGVNVTVNSGTAGASVRVPLIREISYPPIPVSMLSVVAAVPSNEPAGAVLAGIVTRSGTTEPVAGAKVTAVGTSFPGLSALSDNNGRFRIVGVPPGRYSLRAEHDGYFPPDSAVPIPILHVASDEHIDDISLRLRRGGAISGKLLGLDGKPLAAVRVSAGLAVPSDSVRFPKETYTNERGEFRIFGLEPGSYIVGANPSTQSTSRNASNVFVRTYFPNTTELFRAVPLDLPEGADIPDINITVQRDSVFRISGQVINTIVAASNIPASSSPAEIHLIPQELSPLDSISFPDPSNRTRADGTFEFPNVQRGSYYLVALAPGAGPSNERASAWTTVRVDQQDLTGITLTVRPGVNVSGRIAVTGDIRMATAFERLRLYAKGAPLNVDGQSYLSRPAVIDSSGAFTISNVSAGTYVFNGAGLPDLYISDVRIGGTSAIHSGVTIGNTAVDSLQVIFGGAGTIVGTVQDALGNGSPGATVVLLPDLQRRGNAALFKTATTSATGTAGRFTIADVPPGNYTILAFQGFSGDPGRSVSLLDEYVTLGQSVTVTADSGVNVSVTVIPKVLP